MSISINNSICLYNHFFINLFWSIWGGNQASTVGHHEHRREKSRSQQAKTWILDLITFFSVWTSESSKPAQAACTSLLPGKKVTVTQAPHGQMSDSSLISSERGTEFGWFGSYSTTSWILYRATWLFHHMLYAPDVSIAISSLRTWSVTCRRTRSKKPIESPLEERACKRLNKNTKTTCNLPHLHPSNHIDIPHLICFTFAYFEGSKINQEIYQKVLRNMYLKICRMIYQNITEHMYVIYKCA